MLHDEEELGDDDAATDASADTDSDELDVPMKAP